MGDAATRFRDWIDAAVVEATGDAITGGIDLKGVSVLKGAAANPPEAEGKFGAALASENPRAG